MPDINLVCIDCSNPFYFNEKDQAYYKTKGYTPPKRCWSCRQRRKNERVNMNPSIESEYRTWTEDDLPKR